LPTPLWNVEVDKTYVQIEIHPIETGHSILFAFPGPAGRQVPYISISDIIEVKPVLHKKGLLRGKNLMIGIYFVRAQDKRYLATIDVEDKYADEIITIIKKLKQVESDRYYWAYRSLNFLTSNKTINVYPNAPFLSEGEEVIWRNFKNYEGNNKEKVYFVELITNYRVFQYDYREHKGSGILFPLLEDTKVVNIKSKSKTNSMGIFTLSAPNLVRGIQDTVNLHLSEDIIFYSEGKPIITFNGITDPQTLMNAILSLKNQSANIGIGYGIQAKQQTHSISKTLNCTKCGNGDNPKTAKFCNQCGSPLFIACNDCKQSNLAGTRFCGYCGSKIND
jgi:Double zinc ribbon